MEKIINDISYLFDLDTKISYDNNDTLVIHINKDYLNDKIIFHSDDIIKIGKNKVKMLNLLSQFSCCSDLCKKLQILIEREAMANNWKDVK